MFASRRGEAKPQKARKVGGVPVSAASWPLVAILGLAGCPPYVVPYDLSATPAERAQYFEPLLSAAGFKQVPIRTPDQKKELESLPPLELSTQTDGQGRNRYSYADPRYCRCIFRGDETAYQRFKEIKLQNELIEQQLGTTEPMP
jgi:hypothetical protein